MFTASSNLLSTSGLTAEQINQYLNGRGVMAGLGQSFVDAEAKYGINAIFGIAQAALESGWGTSIIAKNKHNLFGMNAYDKDPYGSAAVYATPEESVNDWAAFMKKNYLTPGGVYYSGATLTGISRHYASDPEYSFKLVKLMNQVAEQLGTLPENAPASLSPIEAGSATSTYTAVKGDNMWKIANNHGMTLNQLEILNPHAGHPAGNFALIWPGDKFALNGPAAQSS